MALLLHESFEGAGYENTWSETIDVGCTLNEDAFVPGTPPPAAGSQCLNAIVLDATYADAYATHAIQDQDVCYARAYIRLVQEGLGAGQGFASIVIQDSSPATVAEVQLYEMGGNLYARYRYYSGGTIASTTGVAISLGAWYKIECKYDITNMEWEWRIDGVTRHSGSLSAATRTPNRIDVGIIGHTGTAQSTLCTDLVAVDNANWPAAINTENNRRSVMSLPWDIIFPVPDGTIDQADRRHLLGLYRGLGAVSYDVSVSLALSNLLAPSAQANVGASLILEQITTVADGGQANTGATATLSHIETITPTSTITAEATLTLGAGVTISTGATAVADASLTLAEILAVTQITGQAVDVDTTLASTYTIAEAAIAAAQATLAIAHTQTLIPSASATAGASLSLAQILTTAQGIGQYIDVDITLVQSLEFTDAAQAVAGAALTLPKIVGVSQSAAATTAASLSLAYQVALTSTTGGTVSATLALAIQQGISATVTLDYNASLALAQIHATAQSAQANTDAALTLNHNLSLVLLAQAITEAGLTLSSIQSITHTATAIIIGLITPDGRTVIIAFDDRTTVIAN